MKRNSNRNKSYHFIPRTPGCYIFKDNKDQILYIGKAINIRNRVKQYFISKKFIDPKTEIMTRQIDKIEFVTTDTELEALILETNLIKKYRPKYNRMMKDDKNYSFLMVTTKEDFPRIDFVRDKKNKKAEYFGPYVNIQAIKRALKQLRHIFPYRSCSREIAIRKDRNGKKIFFSSNRKPCLYHHLHLCDAPCRGDVTKIQYRKNINNIKRFFRSKKFEIIEVLKKEMKQFASKKKYEEAAIVRDKIEDLSYVAQRVKVEMDMDENLWRKKKDTSTKKALKKFIKKLKIKNLKYKKDFRIECYDISNIQGKSATGSMIVFTDGKPDKDKYRKFKIRTKEAPDDYTMLKEVLRRRFKKKESKDKSFSRYPDLLIIDGGKGQLSSVKNILTGYNLEVPVIGLAKREEEIFKYKKSKFKKTKLRKGSDELFLIQRIRDEAHRFAIKYHRILRSKKQVKSILDDIPGVGKIVRKRLLKAFGSADNIKKASVEDLQSVVKNKRTVRNIKKLV